MQTNTLVRFRCDMQNPLMDIVCAEALWETQISQGRIEVTHDGIVRGDVYVTIACEIWAYMQSVWGELFMCNYRINSFWLLFLKAMIIKDHTRHRTPVTTVRMVSELKWNMGFHEICFVRQEKVRKGMERRKGNLTFVAWLG